MKQEEVGRPRIRTPVERDPSLPSLSEIARVSRYRSPVLLLVGDPLVHLAARANVESRRRKAAAPVPFPESATDDSIETRLEAPHREMMRGGHDDGTGPALEESGPTRTHLHQTTARKAPSGRDPEPRAEWKPESKLTRRVGRRSRQDPGRLGASFGELGEAPSQTRARPGLLRG